MQDINNKLKEILEKLTDFFENFPSADHRTEAGHHY